MPTTAAGTAYTIYTSTATGYGTAVYAVANAHHGDANIPTVVYAHGAGGAYNQFATLAGWTGLRDWLIDNGGAWIEGAGGLTNTDGEQNWGNANARLAYVAYVNWAATQINLGALVPLGRSMGGLIAPWLYLRSSIAGQCTGLIVNSGVQTMSAGILNDSNSDNRPTGQYFSPTIYNSYGASNYATFVVASTDYDPMNFDVSLWDGKKVLQLVGSADTTVPRATRGADPLRALYAGRPAIDRLDVRAGGDHSQANGSYLQVAAMTAFLTEISFITATPAVPPTYYRVLGHWLYSGGERYAMTPTL